MYFSKLCGICGSLDGEKSEPLTGPHKVKYSQPEPFISSYLIPEGKCDVERIHTQHRVPQIRTKSSKSLYTL